MITNQGTFGTHIKKVVVVMKPNDGGSSREKGNTLVEVLYSTPILLRVLDKTQGLTSLTATNPYRMASLKIKLSGSKNHTDRATN